MDMKSGEIRKLPVASSPLFVSQWAYRGSAKAPYIVSWKPVNHPTPTGVREWQCSCKSWTTTVPRQKCKHIVAVMLKEKILVDITPAEWKSDPVKKPAGDHVVISKDEHEEYKKFLAARGTRKAGNQFDEEGRRFRP